VRRHNQDRGRFRQRASPGFQLHDPQRIIHERRCTVTEVESGHPARLDRAGGPLADQRGRIGGRRLVVGACPVSSSSIRARAVEAAADGSLVSAVTLARLARRDGQDRQMRVLVLSDTHAPRRWKACPPAVAAQLREADLILHAGDVCTASVLDELVSYAPVRAVVGNNDEPDVAAWGAEPTLQLELAGLRVGMIHDSGAATGRLRRMRRAFPAVDLVVFGHSHIPLDEADASLRIFNPGSPTDRRRQPHGTVGVLQIDDGRLVEARLVEVG
jgi:hypothetical protein